MLAIATTAVLVAVVLAIPGYVLVRVALPLEGRLFAAACAVPVSFGIIYLVALWWQQLGVPITSLTILAPLAVVAGVGFWRMPRPRRMGRPRSVEAWLALLATGVSFGLWAVGLGWPTARPNSDDGLNHSIFTHLIGVTDSIDPARVLVTDIPSGEQAVAYYPLATHVLAAVVRPITGADAGQAFLVTAVMASVLALPWGIAAVSRRLFGRGPAAGIAALLGATSSGLVFWPTLWGGYTLILGMSMAYGVLALVWALTRQRGVGAIAVSVLAILGLVGVHTSEVFLVAIVAGVTLFPLIVRRDDRWRMIGVLLVTAFSALVLLIPAITALRGGFSERYGVVQDIDLVTGNAWIIAATLGQLSALVVVLTLAGFIHAIVMRRARLWALLLAISVAIYGLALDIDAPLLDIVTAPWYSAPYRLAVNCVWFAIPLAGAGSLVVARLVVQPFKDPTLRRVATAGLVVVAAIAVVGDTVDARRVIQRGIGDQVVREADYRAAFAYLADRVGDDERVLNARPDGSGWMLPWLGIHPVYGVRFDGLQDGPAWDSRWYLVEHVHEAGANQKVDDLLDEWGIRYVVAGDAIATFEDKGRFALMIDREGMRKSPAFDVVFDSEAMTVFEYLGDAQPKG